MIDTAKTLSANIADATSPPIVPPLDVTAPIAKPIGEPAVEVTTTPSVQQPLVRPLPLKI